MEQTTTEKNIASILSNQMADAVERVSSALVLVNGRQGRPASGIVYAQDLVLTADHVLEREDVHLAFQLGRAHCSACKHVKKGDSTLVTAIFVS